MIVKAYWEDGDVVVQAIGIPWEGLMAHGPDLETAFRNFGECAKLYDAMARGVPEA
jgi:hypothetical protein